jgi:hypothetical protein
MRKLSRNKLIEVSLVVLGLLLMIIGRFVEDSEKIPIVDKWLFGSYYDAKAGIAKLSEVKVLSPNDLGFQTISEWFEENVIKSKKFKTSVLKQYGEEAYNTLLNSEVTMIRMTKEPMAAPMTKEGTLEVELISIMELTFFMEQPSKPVIYTFHNLEKQLEVEYREKPLAKISKWVFWTGVLLVVCEVFYIALGKE